MPNQQKPLTGTGHIWRPFIIHISLIIILFFVGIFISFAARTDHIISNQLTAIAKAHFHNVVLTRRWNADYGGVFVKKTEGVISNPYLKTPDIETKDGAVYTQKNPSLMTKELSEYAEKAGDFKYHMTSLLPLNPANAPDDFETNALKLFEKGDPEVFATFTENDKTVLRYMAPLRVEKGCLDCHAGQGYNGGDIRGGLSVSFDITAVEKEIAINKMIMAVLSIPTAAALLTIIFFLVSRLAGKLSDAYRTIEHMSITDELTQIYNRRHFHTRLREEIARHIRYHHPLSLLMLDIDHFKKVNDEYGHLVGDRILAGVAGAVKSNTRSVDVVARYGGEEIVVVLPETDENSAAVTAEKIRKSIERCDFMSMEGEKIRVTASIGISSMNMVVNRNNKESERLVKLADDALYAAKEAGRNKVVLSKGNEKTG